MLLPECNIEKRKKCLTSAELSVGNMSHPTGELARGGVTLTVGTSLHATSS